MPQEPLLAVRPVAKSFAAVRDVSFPLHPGEVHALVGENGAGSSTIVKMIAKASIPDGPAVLIGGPRGARRVRKATFLNPGDLNVAFLNRRRPRHEPRGDVHR